MILTRSNVIFDVHVQYLIRTRNKLRLIKQNDAFNLSLNDYKEDSGRDTI